jgi:hypothetical protein
MSSSVSNFGSSATPLPSADAWGNLKLGTSTVAASVVNGSGISSVQRNSTGIHGISFSDPTRFGSGAYVFLVTPEYASNSVGPFVVSGVKEGGVTAPGFSAGFALSCYGFQTPAVAGGFTISGPLDAPTNTVWANVAAFSFKTTRDLYDPYVANLIQYSEDLTQWSNIISGTGVNPIVESNVEPNPVTGEMNADKITLNIGATSANTSDYSILARNVQFNSDFRGVTGPNGLFTWSFWAKSAGLGTTLSIRGPAGGAYTHITLTSNWKRYSGTEQIANSAATSMSGMNFTLRGNYDSGLNQSKVSAYIWGVQVEPGSVASPYVKTEGTYPVFGNQDAKKRFVPGASGYGLTGATYSSSITALNSTRTPTAYGTIVIPPKKHDGTDANVVAYIQDGYNVSGVSAGDYSVFDVSFIKPLNTANYCVILSREIEPQYAAADYAQTYEYAICAIDRSQKTVNGFRAFTLKQMETTNNIQKRGVAYGLGLTERIHFMVFGGGTYGQS